MDRYQKLEKSAVMGEGTYGVVYKAKDKHTDTIVALKRIRLELEDEGIPSTTLREISVLRQLKHPNIVALNDVVQTDGRLYLVFEFVDQDLKKYLDACEGFLSPELVLSYTHQLLLGMEFCHIRGIMHRDMKPQNLLVSRDGRLKIADFGLARAFVPPIRPFTHEVVTLWYRPPEILLGVKTYSLPVDMWSVGVIIGEMVTKKPMFPGDSEIDELFKMFRVFGTPSEDTWPGVSALQDWQRDFPRFPSTQLDHVLLGMSRTGIDMLEQILILDPRQRLSASEALRHPYLRDMASSGGGAGKSFF